MFFFLFFYATETTEIFTLSLHDALPICRGAEAYLVALVRVLLVVGPEGVRGVAEPGRPGGRPSYGITVRVGPRWKEREYRSEEHTSELQSRFDLVCRLLLEKKKKKQKPK